MGSASQPSRDTSRAHMIEYDRERRKRANRLFHWSLDMPPEDDDVDVRVNKGIGWREMAVIGAVGLGAAWMFSDRSLPTIPSVNPPAKSPVDSEYEVRFYDASGKVIEVPHISQRQESD